MTIAKLHTDVNVDKVHKRAKKLDPEGQSKHEHRSILFFECGSKHRCPTHVEENVENSIMCECSSENPEVFSIIDDLVIVQ